MAEALRQDRHCVSKRDKTAPYSILDSEKRNGDPKVAVHAKSLVFVPIPKPLPASGSGL
jgi:hypothetical protein